MTPEDWTGALRQPASRATTQGSYDMAGPRMSLLLAGDAMITRPWSHIADPQFLELISEIRSADVAIVNLETVIHNFEHPAQPESGGSWTASPPLIAAELRWAGVDMLAHANNHATDYGPGGIRETLRHVEDAGLLLAGSGLDLQSACAPAYLKRGESTIAHVSMASTFVRYGRASKSRGDFKGRPGINPLTLTKEAVLTIPPSFDWIIKTLSWLRTRVRGTSGNKSAVRLFGVVWSRGPRLRLQRGRRPIDADAEANLSAIRDAASKADLTIVSVHAHGQGDWLRNFARRAIATGADVVFVHGPHEVRGIELHGAKPIFYGLGDFVYEPHGIARFPQEAYDKFGLPDDASADDLRAKVRAKPMAIRRETYEGAAAVLQYEAGGLARIELLPVDLQFEAEPDTRGRPRLAEASLGRKIITDIAANSSAYGTKVVYDEVRNRGVVQMM